MLSPQGAAWFGRREELHPEALMIWPLLANASHSFEGNTASQYFIAPNSRSRPQCKLRMWQQLKKMLRNVLIINSKFHSAASGFSSRRLDEVAKAAAAKESETAQELRQLKEPNPTQRYKMLQDDTTDLHVRIINQVYKIIQPHSFFKNFSYFCKHSVWTSSPHSQSGEGAKWSRNQELEREGISVGMTFQSHVQFQRHFFTVAMRWGLPPVVL